MGRSLASGDSNLAPRPEFYGVEATGYCEQGSPPDGSVQLRESWRVRQRMTQLPQSSREDDDSVGQQHDPCEKPDRHCCAHGLLLYQKAMFSARNTMKTIEAHTMGF